MRQYTEKRGGWCVVGRRFGSVGRKPNLLKPIKGPHRPMNISPRLLLLVFLRAKMFTSRQRFSQFTTLPLCSPKPFLSPLRTTTALSGGSPPSPPPEDAVLAELILNSTAQSLPQVIRESDLKWTQSLVDKTIKRLWNHAPKAIQFFQTLIRLPNYSPYASSFDHAIDLAARLRDYRTAWAFVAQMRALRLGPSPKTLAIIAERYVSAGKPDRAIKVFLSMHEHGCRQDLNSFNTILDILCKSGRVEMAYNKLFRVFKGRFKADSVSYNIIANGWCLKKCTPKALEVLKEMVESGLTPVSNTYNIMLNGFFKAGQIDEAWKFFLQMKKRKCEIDVVTYTTVVHGLGVAGEISRARKVFDEMVKEGILPSVATYNAMIQVFCKKDNVENALLVFDEMLRKGYAPNTTTYNVVIRGLCHAGHMDRAVDFMMRMHGDGCKPNVQTYNVVIRYFCDAGEIERGLDLFGKMRGEGDYLPNLDTYHILISSMFVRKKSDDLVVAGKLLIEMVDRGFMPRKFTFNRVLNGLLLTGNQDFAKEILRMQSKFQRIARHFKL
ncbi:pentatricopeptide repeat-containing protein At1g74900, mitochondrial [Punica granatum]|uniref:Pentatricopeptide repeat-containing protein At1g74900, mitochondrial n=1 Tax=Punica granatum TaxID=22663 RepID=A0A6P8ED90_PUNGR|nr:pentatricopeptide repeat-containing protein At1g74900, mitochondrial [Punica granatum]XP_031403386.1 pentatricopeptide repeat-containing protein At1g74900, mitochondrial [Punica granatum]